MTPPRRVAEAALSEPSGIVRRVIFPVAGGEKTLKALEPTSRLTTPPPTRTARPQTV
ncbi:hypothetical protein [Streptomyces luteoverticillatus]|uniref:hypothetical protein n=1 Tax=Streptomyces luteoverticillatus TaxID=66425 RepID=UPI0013DF4170|nr:hypothetical protein [Streptomyces luteoverticillatus]